MKEGCLPEKWARERGENGERERGKNSAERNAVKKNPLLLVQ